MRHPSVITPRYEVKPCRYTAGGAPIWAVFDRKTGEQASWHAFAVKREAVEHALEIDQEPEKTP